MFMIDIPQLEFIYYKQRAVLAWMSARFGIHFVIVSLYREPKGSNSPQSVHEVIPLRGTDLRCHDEDLGRIIKMRTNLHWKYDPQRPLKKVVRCHGPEIGSPLHLHVQTHPRTVEV